MNHHFIYAVDIGAETQLKDDVTLSSYTSISQILSPLLKNSLTLAGIIFLALIVVGGIGMIASAGSGDQKKAEQSKKTITSAVIGFIVVFCAYFIIQIITVLTGVEILNSTL